MINVEEWFMIRELARQGLSITDIAQRLGLSSPQKKEISY